MKNPLISIIVPVYDRRTSIECCLRSVLQQRCKDFELIIVDDGSTDGSDSICKRIAENDNRVIFISQGNKGVSAARNAGIDIAKGDWITFLDSDDAITPNHFDIVINELHSNADLLMCGHGGGKLKNGQIIAHAKCKEFIRHESDNATEYLFNDFNPFKNSFFYIWDKFFKRDILDINNIRFNVSMSLGEDQVFVCNYLHYARKIVHYNSETHCRMGWKGLTHLGGKLRSASDYLYNQKLNYNALRSICNAAPYSVAGGG